MADSSNRKGQEAFNLQIRVRAPYPLPVGRRTTEVRQIVALKMRVRLPPVNPAEASVQNASFCRIAGGGFFCLKLFINNLDKPSPK